MDKLRLEKLECAVDPAEFDRLGSILDLIKKPMKSHTEIWYAVIVGDRPMAAFADADVAHADAAEYLQNPATVERVRVTIDRIAS